MRIRSLGHVVLKVRDLKRSVPFYGEVLGLKEVARFPERRRVFFIMGSWDVATDARAAPPRRP